MNEKNGTSNNVQAYGDRSDSRVIRAPVDNVPAWIREQDGKEKLAKDAIGYYVAKHIVTFGDFLLMGPGTSLNSVMRQWIKIHTSIGLPQDLEIQTTNLEIMELGNRARQEAFRSFEGLRIVLAGGQVSPSMNCLVGDIAAASILAKNIHPNVVLFGVHGLDFDNGDVRLIYRYSDELSIQTAYATRATQRRVLVCDAKKLGRRIGYAIGVTVESLLADSEECIIVTNLPCDQSDARRFAEQIQAFEKLITTLHKTQRFPDKNLALRVLNQDGGVHREFSLKAMREDGGTTKPSGSAVDLSSGLVTGCERSAREVFSLIGPK